MRRVYLIVVSIFYLAACHHNDPVISGKIEGGAGKTIYLERFVNNRGVKTDSTVLASDGSFVLNPSQPMEMNYYRLLLKERDFIVLITDSTEKVHIEGKAGELNTTAIVSGSPNTAQLREFEQNCQKIYEKEQKAIGNIRMPGISAEQMAQYRQEIMDSRKELSGFVKKWLESNSSVPSALAAVQILDIRVELPTYQKVVSDLGKTFGHSTHYKMLKQKVEGAASAPADLVDPRDMGDEEMTDSPVAIGKVPPEIALPDPKGKIRKLSDLRGKVVLIDFWASWCGPCRRENPNVVKAYNKYNSLGFEILSVSLDKDANAWKQAIIQDGLIWPNHLSDLQFWNSKAAMDYGVHSIPFPVLVGQDGKVIAYGSNVRGDLLEGHLKELLGR
ncbi:MAG: AhpC/TSA family protein [Crocinitomicaceae bacterium]|nr:AhpC/TSA family protein [Crocinitomicaceae bacterium]